MITNGVESAGHQSPPSGQLILPVHSSAELTFLDSNNTLMYTSHPLAAGCTVVPVSLPAPLDVKSMDFVDMLPLPPSPHLLAAGVDDIDNLPLPPPPLELCPGYLHQPSPDMSAVSRTNQPSMPISAVVDNSSHASRRDILRNMSHVSSSVETSGSSVMRRAVSARRASEISHFGFSRTAPTKPSAGDDRAKCNFDEGLVETLKKGVKLKKTVSRDRSAPRLPIQRD